MEIFRATSSSSQSVVVLPSAIFPQRGVMPAVKSNDDTSCVLPVPPWPTIPTFRMSLVRYVFMQTSIRRGPSARNRARACAWQVGTEGGERGRCTSVPVGRGRRSVQQSLVRSPDEADANTGKEREQRARRREFRVGKGTLVGEKVAPSTGKKYQD